MPFPLRDNLAAASLTRIVTRAGAGQTALAGLSLSVAHGEIVTLLGDDAGPKTALAVLAGFAKPVSGEIGIQGRTLYRTPPHRRRVGMVARPLALFPHVDVAGHAGFAPGVTAARATEMLRRLGLLPFARALPRALPDTLRFRVALARALAPARDLLLLDDPLAALPQAAREEAKTLMRALARELGVAMLHATGDAGAAFGLSDRIGVMQAGQLLQIDEPQTLYESPHSLAVARRLGPLNCLPGTKLDQEDDIARIRIGSELVVEARCQDDLAIGEPCVVAIRPERIAVVAVPAAEMGDGALPARLLETLFEGEHIRLRFTVGERTERLELTVLRPSGLAPPRGTAISLAWQPHHAHAFRETTA